MKIQSITDVITNSSTEVYVYYPDETAQKVIDVIDDLLELAGDERDALDIFDIQMKPSSHYYDMYYEAWDNEELDHSQWPEQPGDQDIIKFIESGHNDYRNWMDYEYPKWDGISVIAKDQSNSRLASKIQGLLDLCSYEGFRDG